MPSFHFVVHCQWTWLSVIWWFSGSRSCNWLWIFMFVHFLFVLFLFPLPSRFLLRTLPLVYLPSVSSCSCFSRFLCCLDLGSIFNIGIFTFISSRCSFSSSTHLSSSTVWPSSAPPLLATLSNVKCFKGVRSLYRMQSTLVGCKEFILLSFFVCCCCLLFFYFYCWFTS